MSAQFAVRYLECLLQSFAFVFFEIKFFVVFILVRLLLQSNIIGCSPCILVVCDLAYIVINIVIGALLSR